VGDVITSSVGPLELLLPKDQQGASWLPLAYPCPKVRQLETHRLPALNQKAHVVANYVVDCLHCGEATDSIGLLTQLQNTGFVGLSK
jgi:hypothetical protein